MTTSKFLVADGVEFYAPNGGALLKSTSFELDEGSILAVAGPNGAGKTTLLNLLCGAIDLTFGDVTVRGHSLRQMSAIDRARVISVVSQQEQPDGRLSLQDYVALGQIPIQAERSPGGHAKDLARILDLTGLVDLATKKMAVLSGGERQRAHIARALAQNPTLLFLDEPTNHLDPDAKGRMLSLVSGLGITVVMILHDLVLIPEFATHVALMKSGTLTGFGTVADVLTTERVQDTFAVDYLFFEHQGRKIPALDIRKTPTQHQTRKNSQ